MEESDRFVSLNEVREGLVAAGSSDVDRGYRREGWIKCRVCTKDLRIMYDDFRFRNLNKGERFSDVVARERQNILAGTFPLAEQIRANRPKPRIVVLRDSKGDLYVLEGQCRTLAAAYQEEEWMDAFLLEVPEETREVF